jgi:hypothetical protein
VAGSCGEAVSFWVKGICISSNFAAGISTTPSLPFSHCLKKIRVQQNYLMILGSFAVCCRIHHHQFGSSFQSYTSISIRFYIVLFVGLIWRRA